MDPDGFLTLWSDQDYYFPLVQSSDEGRSNCNIETATQTDPGRLSRPNWYPGRVDKDTRGGFHSIDSNDTLTNAFPDVITGQDASPKLNQYSASSMGFTDQDWSPPGSSSLDPIMLDYSSSPINAQWISNSMSLACWEANGYFDSQYAPMNPSPAISGDQLSKTQNVSPPDINAYPTNPEFPKHRHQTPSVDSEPTRDQSPSTAATTPETEDTVTSIGSVLSNGKFACDAEKCHGRTFGRHAELRRHHATRHATCKPNFWCRVPTCRRSIGGGGKAFYRKDKLWAHVRSMHPGVR